VTPASYIVVGDVHAVPEELEDCNALLELVHETSVQHMVDVVIWMGDQYNNHDAVSVRCIEFWKRAFEQERSIALLGNHDQTNPTDRFPHAMLAHPNTRVADMATIMAVREGVRVAMMPYFYDSVEFVEYAKALHQRNPEVKTLFCHQTFAGGQFDNGTPIYDAVDPDDIPFETIISGHIHRPQVVGGKVIYVGAPRWRTLSDAGSERYIYVYHQDDTESAPVEVARVSTGSACRRIWSFQDSPTAPADLSCVPTGKRRPDRISVDVYGPPDYVRDRQAELKAAYGALTRGFPIRERRAALRESEGVDIAFGKFTKQFNPPHGTPSDDLCAAIGERLGIAA
jgi:DNA repair exonuclease SbcCD nuclease subunit